MQSVSILKNKSGTNFSQPKILRALFDGIFALWKTLKVCIEFSRRRRSLTSAADFVEISNGTSSRLNECKKQNDGLLRLTGLTSYQVASATTAPNRLESVFDLRDHIQTFSLIDGNSVRWNFSIQN